MSAILSPASDATIARVDPLGIHRDALAACDLFERRGLHLQAAAGRARVSAMLASLVADHAHDCRLEAARAWGLDVDGYEATIAEDDALAYEVALREWEASPSATARRLLDKAAERAYASAVNTWEASPDSSTRHALNGAAVNAGYACAGCGMTPAACESGDPRGCHAR